MSPHNCPPDRPIETPMSDALVVRMLLVAERQLAVLERMPTRRRKSRARQLKQMRTINTLIKSFAWLMQRHEAMLQERAKYPPERDEEMRKELKRRLDLYLADAAESENTVTGAVFPNSQASKRR